MYNDSYNRSMCEPQTEKKQTKKFVTDKRLMKQYFFKLTREPIKNIR